MAATTTTSLANSASTATTHASMGSNIKVPYLVEVEINWADVLASKGSALEANEVVQCIRVPAGTIILGAGAQVVTAVDATAATIDVGITGGDTDEWVNDFDIKGTAGTYSTDLSASPVWTTLGTADTIDILLASLTGTLAAGKTRVYALLQDVSPKKVPGLVALGS